MRISELTPRVLSNLLVHPQSVVITSCTTATASRCPSYHEVDCSNVSWWNWLALRDWPCHLRPKRACVQTGPVEGLRRIRQPQVAHEMSTAYTISIRRPAESLAGLPTVCDTAVKRNAKGYQESWNVYRLRIDAIDGGLPVSCLLSSASLRDSQAARLRSGPEASGWCTWRSSIPTRGGTLRRRRS